jgi:hypothetical protein
MPEAARAVVRTSHGLAEKEWRFFLDLRRLVVIGAVHTQLPGL